MFKYELGVIVKDSITGFTGAVTGRADYITGCSQYLVQPKSKKPDEIKGSIWFDEQRLSPIANRKKIVLDNEKPGSCGEAPIK